MIKLEKSCGAIIIYQNQVLLVKQENGVIGFPKGHMEPNETEIKTAIREVKEETNLDIQILENIKYSIHYSINQNRHKEVIYFLAKPVGNIKLIPQKGEIKKVMWVKQELVNEYLIYQNLKNIWRQAQKEIRYLNFK